MSPQMLMEDFMAHQELEKLLVCFGHQPYKAGVATPKVAPNLRFVTSKFLRYHSARVCCFIDDSLQIRLCFFFRPLRHSRLQWWYDSTRVLSKPHTVTSRCELSNAQVGHVRYGGSLGWEGHWVDCKEYACHCLVECSVGVRCE